MKKSIYLLNNDAQEMKIELIDNGDAELNHVLISIHGGHPISFNGANLGKLLNTLIDCEKELFQ